MIRKHSIVLLVVLAALFLSTAIGQVQPTKKIVPQMQSVPSSTGMPAYAILNINNITSWMRSDGQSNRSPQNDAGTYFPRGTVSVIYEDGIVWGGKAYLDVARTRPAPGQLIRVGGGTYSVGTKAGWVNGSGATAVRTDTMDSAVRVYRIRRDYFDLFIEDLRRDAAEVNEMAYSLVTDAQIAAVKNQYELDWKNWPVHRGAPYIERNGIPGYQPPPPFGYFFTPETLISAKYDEPGITGIDPTAPADQVIWTVFNDLHAAQTRSFAGSEPLGLEIQKTVWGYKRYDEMGNMYFTQIKLINKGGVDIGDGAKGALYIDSLFVAQWTDPDLGSHSDDLGGCDVSLDLGYVYNSTSLDSQFRKFNFPPPAVGYTLLSGPIVPSATDSATFNLRRRLGYKNLRMSSFFLHMPGDPYSDPPNSYNDGSGRWWKHLRGFAPLGDFSTPDQLYPSGPFPPSKFPYSGDPVSKTGWIDGMGTIYSGIPGDRRFLLSVGPFTLAPGDTQEVLIGVMAGLGVDHLSSVTVMKHNVRIAQNMARRLFDVVRPPAAPAVRTTELDQQIILEWGTDNQRVKETENRIISGDYVFEGYNVYQLPSARSPLSNGKKIATFDVKNGVTKIFEDRFDSNSGLVVPTIVQTGSDNGVQRFIKIARDYLSESFREEPLHNGQEYFFAVTAYNHTAVPGSSPKALESSPVFIRAKPRIPFGLKLPVSHGDTLLVTHTSGKSDGVVFPIVIDPTLGSGDDYEVRFDTTGGTTTWSLRNATTNTYVLSRQTNQSGDENYQTTEGGIFLIVKGPSAGLKRGGAGWSWEGISLLTWRSGDGLQFEGFGGAIGWESPFHYSTGWGMQVRASELKTVQIRLAMTNDNAGRFNASEVNASYGYRYGRSFSNAPARPEFTPYLINRSAGYAFQDYTLSIPLAVYDMDASPPRRLAVGFLENNVANGMVDGRYWPPDHGIANNTDASGPREWLFIFNNDYTGTIPNPNLQKDIFNNPLPVMYWATWTRSNNSPWPSGSILTIISNKQNSPSDVFSYSVPAPEKGLEVERASAQLVGVFPNPYVAGHTQETSPARRFVTFNNLPPKAKVRIYNLAGHLVRTLEKDNPSQFLEWDLTNENNWQVASGIYICYVEMPDLNVSRVVKLAVIQPQLIR